MKKFKFTIRGNTYEVEILKHERNHFRIDVNGTEYEVEMEKEIKTSTRPTLVRTTVPQPKTSEKKIKKDITSKAFKIIAPLPGTILKIFVSEGDQVKKGDNLMIMEAMKMENNVLAEKDGTIQSIKVNVGDTVLQNDLLIEIQ